MPLQFYGEIMEENPNKTSTLPPYYTRYIRNENGKLVLDPECVALAKKYYWKDRPAYDPNDRRVMIGRYDENGTLIPFSKPR